VIRKAKDGSGPPDEPEDDVTSRHIRGAIGGAHASVAWLVERFDPCLAAMAEYHLAGRLRRIADPEDLVMETWAVVLRKLPELRFDPASSTRGFLAFLTTTLRHHVQNLLRKSIRRLQKGDPGAWADPPASAVLDSLPADITHVTRKARQSEARERFAAALRELDPKDREVVVLRGLEQVSNQEAASLLGIEEGTLAVRYHRALKKLAERLPDSVFAELVA
jgi:RNA polymerase sigma-70 factor, ECF subfamily